MATATITITVGSTVYGATKTLSANDLTRLLNAYTAKFGTTSNDSTGQAWAQQLIDLTKQTVHSYEETVAVTSARAGVSDIGFT